MTEEIKEEIKDEEQEQATAEELKEVEELKAKALTLLEHTTRTILADLEHSAPKMSTNGLLGALEAAMLNLGGAKKAVSILQEELAKRGVAAQVIDMNEVVSSLADLLQSVYARATDEDDEPCDCPRCTGSEIKA